MPAQQQDTSVQQSGASQFGQFLQFGIPSLDGLFGAAGRDATGTRLCGMTAGTGDGRQFETTSICLAGPSGTGKSILALHLAAYYRAQHGVLPRIIYASTDFSWAKANMVWTKFSLSTPIKRKPPFASPDFLQPEWRLSEDCEIRLRPVATSDFWQHDSDAIRWLNCGIDPVNQQIPSELRAEDIIFLSLNSSTGGDEWQLLNRLIAALTARQNGEPQPPHLLIVDAVEGLEMFSGEHDVYGEKRNRRGRVTQLLRTATGKCHVAFIVEDATEQEDRPEEFITDFVLRLHREVTRGYGRRTVEVHKARGQAHQRGRHTYVIRSGEGSYAQKPGAGVEARYNPDDPKVFVANPEQTHGYVHVFHSLHSVSREDMYARGYLLAAKTEKGESEVGMHAGFGIRYLDELLSGPGPRAGLPLGRLFALIGDDGTHKGRLARAFLAGCFRHEDAEGIGVFISMQDLDPLTLATRIHLHLSQADRKNMDVNAIANNLVCRRLETHDLTPAVLLHIIRCAVEDAKQRLNARYDKCPEMVQHPGRVRLVVDDWNALRIGYPDVASDSLFLPALLLYLERQRITTLLIDTQPGSPARIIEDEYARDLRALVRHHIYTWHTQFYGENRIAITLIPPISDSLRNVVRELRPAPPMEDEQWTEEAMTVDPHFELYSGLETGHPRPVPLQVRLYAKTPAFESYMAHLTQLLGESFQPIPQQPLVVSDTMKEYERLRQFTNVQSETRLDHTLIFEIDEFWLQRPARTTLQPLDDYLNAVTCHYSVGTKNESDEDRAKRIKDVKERLFQDQCEIADPFQVFRGRPSPDFKSNSSIDEVCRRQFFHRRGYDIENFRTGKDGRRPYRLDRVPFMWDFGFVACLESLWSSAGKERIQPEGTSGPERIEDILKPQGWTQGSFIGWRDFLAACVTIRDWHAQRGNSNYVAFDLDLRSVEAFSCFVLEVWFSEIESVDKDALLCHRDRNPHVNRSEGNKRKRLSSLIQSYEKELFKAWLLIGEVLPPDQFPGDGFYMYPRAARTDAIAARHWYSTATTLPVDDSTPRMFMRLPGQYTTRGDWYLALAKGSRSERLGWRALDFLSSLQENVARLQSGLGLPTRDYVGNDGVDMSDKLQSALVEISIGGIRRPLKYGDILTRLSAEQQCNFFWLFRSTIREYGTQSRRWSKCLYRLLTHWREWRTAKTNGFIDYDRLSANPSDDQFGRTKGWKEFRDELKFAIASIESSPSAP